METSTDERRSGKRRLAAKLVAFLAVDQVVIPLIFLLLAVALWGIYEVVT
jgi:hypothetical protein